MLQTLSNKGTLSISQNEQRFNSQLNGYRHWLQRWIQTRTTYPSPTHVFIPANTCVHSRQHMCSFPFLVWSVLLIVSVFCVIPSPSFQFSVLSPPPCCVFVLCPGANSICVHILSILDCPLAFLLCLYMLATRRHFLKCEFHDGCYILSIERYEPV